MEQLREELKQIKDDLTEIIPKLEAEGMDHESVTDLQEAKIVIWWKIAEIDLLQEKTP